MSLKDSDFSGSDWVPDFPNFIQRCVMSVVFLLLAVGVMLAGFWVLSTLISIR